MIKLQEVKIIGFKNEKTSIKLEFSTEPASVIFGDNGCGKTTFLKLLQSVLSRDESTLVSEDVSEVAIKYSYDHENKKHFEEVIISKVETNEISDDEFDDLFGSDNPFGTDNQYDWNEYDSSYLSNCRSISLGVDRGYPSPRLNASSGQLMKFIQTRKTLRSNFKSLTGIKIFADELSFFLSSRNRDSGIESKLGDRVDHISLKDINMKNVGEILHMRYRTARRNAARRVQNALFDTLAVAIRDQNQHVSKEVIINQAFDELIFENKELIIEALDDSQENSFKYTIISALKKIETINNVEIIRENKLLSKLLMKMAEELKDSEEELFAVNTVIDKFDSFTSEGKSLHIAMDQVLVNSKTGTHTIDELSSGERHILTLLTLLLDQGRGRDLIIIDEPEISLNTKWQEILLQTLSDILPNSQIIVASHSPIIAESVDNLVEFQVL